MTPEPRLLQQHAIKAVEEIALALLDAAPGDDHRLAPARAHAAGVAAAPCCAAFPYAHGWLELKGHYLAGDDVAFLSAATPFLAAGPGASPVLWHATARDLHALCLDVASAAAFTLAGYLERVSAAITNVPPAFRIVPGVR